MAEEGFLGVIGRLASTFVGGAPDGHRHVWNAVAPWVNDLVRNATALWLPNLVVHIPCEVFFREPQSGVGVQCSGSAIAACAVCKKPCCLNHAFVSRAGGAVCFPCVQQDIAQHAPKIPWPHGTRGAGSNSGADAPPRQREEKSAPPAASEIPLDVRMAVARKVLRVKRSATWPEVEAAYKALLRKHHPDRNPNNRQQAEERFKEVRAAYDFLKSTREVHL